MKLIPGSILLTSSVGGTDTNWRNRLLGKLILDAQKMTEMDGQVGYSHAELITSAEGHTFAARWRTREREPAKGIDAYIGANVLIAVPKSLTLWPAAWRRTKQKFDGNIYPVDRLLLQGVSKIVFPWLTKINFSGRGICSEVVGFSQWKQLHTDYWIGMTPAELENQVKTRPSVYDVVFEGVWKGMNA